MKPGDDIIVAAGIAVQSQWYIPILDSYHRPGAGLGIAQVKDEDMDAYGLAGQDQNDPSVAIKAMRARIALVTSVCPSCSARDKLIAAAFAQNRGFEARDMRDAMRYMKNGYIDWNVYISRLDPQGGLPGIRATSWRYNYNTRFQLQLFMNDLRELQARGWTLPEEYQAMTKDDWNYIRKLQWGIRYPTNSRIMKAI